MNFGWILIFRFLKPLRKSNLQRIGAEAKNSTRETNPQLILSELKIISCQPPSLPS
jgi:hypothetical protein